PPSRGTRHAAAPLPHAPCFCHADLCRLAHTVPFVGIVRGGAQGIRVLAKEAEADIATGAQQTPHPAGLVAMIDPQRPAEVALAHGTTAILLLQHPLIVLGRHAVPAPAMARCRLGFVALAIFRIGAPFQAPRRVDLVAVLDAIGAVRLLPFFVLPLVVGTFGRVSLFAILRVRLAFLLLLLGDPGNDLLAMAIIVGAALRLHAFAIFGIFCVPLLSPADGRGLVSLLVPLFALVAVV